MPNNNSSGTSTMPLRRSARLAALQERRRESEENALRQQRERIAQTHRHVSSRNHHPSSTNTVPGTSITLRLPTPPPILRIRQRTGPYNRARTAAAAIMIDLEPPRPRVFRRHATVRGPAARNINYHQHFHQNEGENMATNPQVLNFSSTSSESADEGNIAHSSVSIANLLQLTNSRGTNTSSSTSTNHMHHPTRMTARMSTGGGGGRFPNRAMRATGSSAAAARMSTGAARMSTGGTNLQQQQQIGILLGNRYSSDSEDSYYQPRVIDPNEISEDESEEETTAAGAPVPIRELTPPAPPAQIIHRPVTRSMSSRPGFYDNPSSSSSAPPPAAAPPRRLPPAIKKKDPKKSLCTCKAGPSNVKTVIKVEKIIPCTICFEDEPKKPVACTYCRQTIGCRHCVKKWFLTTNMSHLDQRTPYPIGGTDRNHRRCPLCRAEWMDVPQVVSVVQSL